MSFTSKITSFTFTSFFNSKTIVKNPFLIVEEIFDTSDTWPKSSSKSSTTILSKSSELAPA